MQRLRRLCAGISFLIILSGCVSTPAQKTDTATIQSSEKENKDVLLLFTGSDWSKEAEDFSNNVLTESFKTALEQHYTVRFIDLPRNPAAANKEVAQKNYLLFSEYAVPDVPFIVLQTAEQDVYASVVIDTEIKTAPQLIEKIDGLSAQRPAVVKARKLIDTTKGVEKAQAIDAFLNIVGNADAHRYDSLRAQVPALDPDNQSGLKGKYQLLIADVRAKTFAQQGDYYKAGDEYKKAAEAGSLAPAELQLAWYLTAYAYLMAGMVETETIIGYLRKAVEADPQNAGVQQINQAIRKLQEKQ